VEHESRRIVAGVGYEREFICEVVGKGAPATHPDFAFLNKFVAPEMLQGFKALARAPARFPAG